MDANRQPNFQTVSLGDRRIGTNVSGLRQIEAFYQRARRFRDTKINIGLREIVAIDGNMSAVLGAALYRLHQDRGLTFTVSFDDVRKRFPILIENGLISTDAIIFKDIERTTTIPFQSFRPDDKDGFIGYLVNKLLVHAGMPHFTPAMMDRLIDDLAELCGNINLHSGTEEPFFVCGQYYPGARKVIFTMTDLGRGFLPKIMEKTGGGISSAREAVLWAISGNTTKVDAPGGIHLNKMRQFFERQNGHMHIITGDAYYSTQHGDSRERPDRVARIEQHFMGSTIHLVFHTNLMTG